MPALAQAQSVADFYRGKSIELLIGGAVGGGYDLAGRTVANHIGRHIPGNPGIVVRNMPGATSLIMTNHLYNVARRNGTVIGMPTSNIPPGTKQIRFRKGVERGDSTPAASLSLLFVLNQNEPM
jgi:tripartite-type tricarboxylate transporter receptor subunit TctC